MNFGNCSICLDNFTPSNMAVLRHCMHTFHRKCIDRAVRIRPECPLCRHQTQLEQIATPLINTQPMPTGDLSKEAFDIALQYYDKIVLKQPAAAAETRTTKGQREQLEVCLNSLLSTIEDQQLEKNEQWDRLLNFIKMASLASVCAILAFFCYIYWPLIAPLASRLSSSIWSLITRLWNFIRSHQPEFATAIFGLMELFIVWTASPPEPEMHGSINGMQIAETIDEEDE